MPKPKAATASDIVAAILAPPSILDEEYNEAPAIAEVSADEASAVDAARSIIYLLDPGVAKYGDCILCRFGQTTILIDGSHPGDYNGSEGHKSIPEQLEAILGPPPHAIDLLVVTHCHSDHIGCLPAIVKDGLLNVTWALVADPNLGWGRTAQDAFRPDDTWDDARILAAALREESRADEKDNAALLQFLTDAGGLEDKYRAMLDALAAAMTNVVYYGRDDEAPLVAAFQSVGMTILGPTQEHLFLCAETIAKVGRDLRDGLPDYLSSDASGDLVQTYRNLAATADQPGGTGPALNDQSIVLLFAHRNRKFLLTGDMQFAKPEVNNLGPHMDALRDVVAAEAPFDLVKIAHHASYNAFDQSVLDEMNATPLYAISTGENSTSHPSRGVLKLLKENRDKFQWARTDHNRLITFNFSGANPRVEVERGFLNDWQPNASDEQVAALVPPVPPASPVPVIPAQPMAEITGIVEVLTRVPHTSTRVTLTIDVEPRQARGVQVPPESRRTGGDQTLRVGGGRPLAPLLFVTSREALACNIGANEADEVLRAITQSGHALYDQIPVNAGSALTVAPNVRAELQRNPNAQGVVILGGYDVVPPLRLDAVPANLRQRLTPQADPDDFVVWSDGLYGDRVGDIMPEVPVSRIPDGRSADLVKTAIQASPRSNGVARSGVRNVARPFADGIFQGVSGTEALHVSQPTVYNQQPAISLDGERVYLMLHGDYSDGSRFWGEDTPNNLEAVNVGNLPAQCGSVVFTGCCWGALSVDQPAVQVTPTTQLSIKAPESSMALSFLARGAVAFVGCTGAHYSPVEKPYRYFGGPMHEEFWRNMQRGSAPAQALFDAKVAYLSGIPHRDKSALAQAIEHKILHQYTCLGLGW